MQNILRYRVINQTLLVVAFAAAFIPTTEASPNLIDFPGLRDMQAALYARRALLEDPALAPFNLGVNVREGVATVWGPVPSDDVGRMAMKRLEGVRGILEVRSDFYPLAPTRDDELLSAPLVLEAPTTSASASPNRDSGQIGTVSASVPLNRESGQLGNLTGLLGPGFPVEDQNNGLQSAVSLLAPVALPEGQSPASSSVAVSPAESISAAIDRLRQADERFRLIATEWKDGAVLLRAGSAPGENLMAFAQAISQLPGVERVVVLNNP